MKHKQEGKKRVTQVDTRFRSQTSVWLRFSTNAKLKRKSEIIFWKSERQRKGNFISEE
mgnify:CR=1 FL=1